MRNEKKRRLVVWIFGLASAFVWVSGWAGEKEEERLGVLLKEGLSFYETIQDYKAIFRQTEGAKGVLGRTEEIYLKFEKPWKIYLGWLDGGKKGLQVVYEKGKNDGKLVVHEPRLLFGLMPVIFLDRKSPWVRQGSAAYDIEDAGIGTFLFDFAKAVIQAQKENRLKVGFLGRVSEGGLEGEKVEVTFPGTKKDSVYFAYRVRVLFDEKTRLPVEMELFDWQNQKTGVYVYQNLKVNVGGNDEEFRKQIDKHLFRIYSGDRG
ncbi:MAG: DUF1571 domain-containing protein [Candidatus Omnitrophica bacterium]|nr:DUF1571 domain-containing protein [Candidatus Omnitrophota bacterium]